jgi:hypothetical protein
MITQEELKNLFKYQDGRLLRINSRKPSNPPNLAANVNGKTYKISQLVFLYHHGYLPKGHIHHINGNSYDNRIENLAPLAKPQLTAEGVHDLFEYRGGDLYWKKPLSGRTKVGEKAGCLVPNGYVLIRIGKRLTKLHHVVFLYHYGYMPKMIDHINGNPSDNRIENLRECDAHGNARNSKKKKKKNGESRFKGVSWKKTHSKWRARIMVDRQEIFLGHFSTEIEAALAYDRAALHYFKEYARCNFTEHSGDNP